MKLQYTGIYPERIKLGDFDGVEVMLDPAIQPMELTDSIGAQVLMTYPTVFTVVTDPAPSAKKNAPVGE